jgi:hypothetical protein
VHNLNCVPSVFGTPQDFSASVAKFQNVHLQGHRCQKLLNFCKTQQESSDNRGDYNIARLVITAQSASATECLTSAVVISTNNSHVYELLQPASRLGPVQVQQNCSC